MEKKKHAVLQITLLFVIQWISVTVIILNVLALDLVKDSNQNLIIATKTGPQEFILLVIGAVSLLTASLLLCIYLHILFRLLGNHFIAPSKKVLITEIGLSVINIALWATASITILICFNQSSSCRQEQLISTSIEDLEDSDRISIKACNFTHAMIAAAFITISVWVLACIMPMHSLFKLVDYNNISEKLTMQQRKSIIYSYESDKLETNRLSSRSSTTVLNLNPSTVITTPVTAEKAIAIIMESPQSDIGTNKLDEEVGLVKTSLSSSNLDQEWGNNVENLQKRKQPYLQEPAAVKISNRNLDYEFMEFEPINIDLMLPSTSELLKGARRKINEKHHYYHYS